MTDRLLKFLLLTMLVASIVACARTPEQEGKAALEHMIVLLEKGKAREMIETYMEPDLMTKLKASGKYERVVQKFEARKAARLVDRLKKIKTRKPEVSQDGQQLVYRQENGRKVGLKKLDGRWYIMNN